MNTNKKSATIDMKVKLSTLWIFVMFNMVFADIVGFMNPGALEQIITGAVGFEITQELLLVFSILLEIPIAMILLSRILKYRANRWANIVAAVITILFVIGGGSTYLSYIFFAMIEVACMLLIIWYAWRWPNPEGSPDNLALYQSKLGGNL
jgi:Sec-independent protein secretion pathway component TatC